MMVDGVAAHTGGQKLAGDGIVFGCATFGQLAHLETAHPVLHRSSRRPRRGQYAGLPGIAEDFPCCFYLAAAAGELAASTIALPDTLWVDGERYPWAWTGDLHTEPAFRGRGLATRLQEASTALLHERGIARGSVFSTETTLHIYRKIGAQVVGYAPRLLMLKSLRPLLAAHLPWAGAARGLAATAGPALRLAMRGRWRFGRRRAGIDRQLRAVAVDAAELREGDFPVPCSRLPFAFDESLTHLAWKIRAAQAAGGECVLYLLVDAGERPQAYFVVRSKRQQEPLAGKYKDFRLLSLMHFGLFGEDPELYAVLADQLLAVFWGSDAEVLEVISSCEPLQKVLRQFGLLAAGKGMSFTVSLPASWRLERPVARLSDWPLTHFRGDACYF